MDFNAGCLKYDERVIFALRSLYTGYGYSCFKMNKFEEYEFYVENKDFLVSDSVITFTDTNGKLMALKPDVTLSIIRHYKDEPGTVQKLFYNENVYRVSKKTRTFKEIMQIGLECIGALDNYCISEVLMLAAQSLRLLGRKCVLDIAHLGIVSSIIDSFSFSDTARKNILKCISEKNVHELSLLARQYGVEENKASALLNLVTLCDKPAVAVPKLKMLLARSGSSRVSNYLAQLEEIVSVFEGTEFADMLRIDFSVVNDLKYYNGIVFRGFVEGVPTGVLSGGQYDSLMRKMKHQAGAIGFAIYLDELERLAPQKDRYDTDVVLLYGRKDDPASVRRAVCALHSLGKSVMAQKEIPSQIRYKELMRLNGSEAVLIERDNQ